MVPQSRAVGGTNAEIARLWGDVWETQGGCHPFGMSYRPGAQPVVSLRSTTGQAAGMPSAWTARHPLHGLTLA